MPASPGQHMLMCENASRNVGYISVTYKLGRHGAPSVVPGSPGSPPHAPPGMPARPPVMAAGTIRNKGVKPRNITFKS